MLIGKFLATNVYVKIQKKRSERSYIDFSIINMEIRGSYPCGLGFQKVYEPSDFEFKIECQCAFLLEERPFIFIRFLKPFLNSKID